MYKNPKLLKIGFFFKPFVVPLQGQLLTKTKLPQDEELIIAALADKYRALLAREMAYHHVAQGELEGEPFLVSF